MTRRSDRRAGRRRAVIASDEEAVAAAAAFAAQIAPRGRRPRRGRGHAPARASCEALAATGLLGMRVPHASAAPACRRDGRRGLPRDLRRRPRRSAQIPQNHVAFVDTSSATAATSSARALPARFLRGARLGNALSERGGRTRARLGHAPARRRPGSGRKYYSTGALTAQWIPVFARDEARRHRGRLRPARRSGRGTSTRTGTPSASAAPSAGRRRFDDVQVETRG